MHADRNTRNYRGLLGSARPRSFEECIEWARMRFEELFHDTIVQARRAAELGARK